MSGIGGASLSIILFFGLPFHNRLATKDRVGRYKKLSDLKCVLYLDQQESREHLFFKCSWVKNCLDAVKVWLEWPCKEDTMEGLCASLEKYRKGPVKRKVILTSLAALIYNIWYARKCVVWTDEKVLEEKVIAQIKSSVRHRIADLFCTAKSKNDSELISKL